MRNPRRLPQMNSDVSALLSVQTHTPPIAFKRESGSNNRTAFIYLQTYLLFSKSATFSILARINPYMIGIDNTPPIAAATSCGQEKLI